MQFNHQKLRGVEITNCSQGRSHHNGFYIALLVNLRSETKMFTAIITWKRRENHTSGWFLPLIQIQLSVLELIKLFKITIASKTLQHLAAGKFCFLVFQKVNSDSQKTWNWWDSSIITIKDSAFILFRDFSSFIVHAKRKYARPIYSYLQSGTQVMILSFVHPHIIRNVAKRPLQCAVSHEKVKMMV